MSNNKMYALADALHLKITEFFNGEGAIFLGSSVFKPKVLPTLNLTFKLNIEASKVYSTGDVALLLSVLGDFWVLAVATSEDSKDFLNTITLRYLNMSRTIDVSQDIKKMAVVGLLGESLQEALNNSKSLCVASFSKGSTNTAWLPVVL